MSLEAPAVGGSWSPSDSPAALGALTIGAEPVEFCDLAPADVERSGKALIRFDLTGLVASWTGGQLSNNGIAIVLPENIAYGLAGQLSKAHLTIRFGYRK